MGGFCGDLQEGEKQKAAELFSPIFRMGWGSLLPGVCILSGASRPPDFPQAGAPGAAFLSYPGMCGGTRSALLEINDAWARPEFLKCRQLPNLLAFLPDSGLHPHPKSRNS